jgi:hypothetical protein
MVRCFFDKEIKWLILKIIEVYGGASIVLAQLILLGLKVNE